MKKKTLDYLTTIIGLAAIFTGLIILKTLVLPQSLLSLPYILIGLGCGIFGHGMGNIISRKALQNNPEMQKQIEIEQKDERNIALSNQAKAKAYDMMIFVFGAMMVSYALMGVELAAILMLVTAYLFVVGYGIFSRARLDKEM